MIDRAGAITCQVHLCKGEGMVCVGGYDCRQISSQEQRHDVGE